MRSEARTEEHVGEWKVSLRADSAEELFAEGARLVAQECGPVSGEYGAWQQLSLEAADMETLLADWLNDVIGRSEIALSAYDDVRVGHIETGGGSASMTAEMRGRPVSDWQSPLKAATYHDLRVWRDDDGWRATVVIDV